MNDRERLIEIARNWSSKPEEGFAKLADRILEEFVSKRSCVKHVDLRENERLREALKLLASGKYGYYEKTEYKYMLEGQKIAKQALGEK